MANERNNQDWYISRIQGFKNIDKDTMISVLRILSGTWLQRCSERTKTLTLVINPEKCDFEIWRNRVVADDELENPTLQITQTEARKIDADCEVGEEVTDEVHFADFGRRAILNLRQTLASKILGITGPIVCLQNIKIKSVRLYLQMYIRFGKRNFTVWWRW